MPQRAHPDTTTKAGGQANRNAGFIRQAGEPHWGCRMNPAFRWWCQDAPCLNQHFRNEVLAEAEPVYAAP